LTEINDLRNILFLQTISEIELYKTFLELFAGQYMPPNHFPELNFTKFVSKTFRTNPAFPLLKFTTALQNIDTERVLIYVYVKNGCKHLH
jgi:hypothetical protein